jgi:hypothetical protein
MYLSNEEERLFEGQEGDAKALAMKILVNLGDLKEADRLIPIRSAHISGVSYKTGGEGLVNYLDSLVKGEAKVTVPSTLNPAGMDLRRWDKMGVPEDFAKVQKRIIDNFAEMGVQLTCACVPYEMSPVAREISLGDHIAWGESNAVIYANSMVGARTNREGGPSSLACAIIGKTPNYGLHLDEGRRPNIEVRVNGEMDHLEFNLLGAHVGNEFPRDRAIFRGIDPGSGREKMKQLGAALAAKGGHPIYHVEGMTPEAHLYPERETEVAHKIEIDAPSLKSLKDELYPPEGSPDLFVLGCPQFGPFEFGRLAKLVKGKRIKKEKRIWVFTGRDMMDLVDDNIIKTILDAGVEIYFDTCMVVTPLMEMNITNVGTDSAKAAHYIPRLLGSRASLIPLESIVEGSLK